MSFVLPNGEKLTTVAEASKDDLDAAVKAARDAWPAWRDVPVAKKYGIFNQIYGASCKRQKTWLWSRLWIPERPQEKRDLKFFYASDQFPYFASAVRVAEDGISSAAPGSRTMVVREPVGIVGAITPWNAPFIMACWKLVPALAAGNSLIIKPSSHTPVSTLELMKSIADLLPPGVVNILTGRGSAVGQWLLDHPGIDKLSFTGSTDVGMTVGKAAAERLIPATLELGGKSAGIYFADIPDMGKALQAAVMNVSDDGGTGMRPSNPYSCARPDI